MEHLGDITEMHGGSIKPAHIITFGSPCQDMSTIGLREGLGGKESGLFYQAIRIIDEMRLATNGEFPVWAVWENVMGAFSSGKRMDFKRVLEAFTKSAVPMPRSARWAYAGLVRGRLPDIAWRLMDARYWGVPQRRRRIFLVADFTAERSSRILFKPRRMFQATQPRPEMWHYSAKGNRVSASETWWELPTLKPFSQRGMRSAAKLGNTKKFARCFGLSTDPFPTLLASGGGNYFSLWQGENYQDGLIRNLTPIECERLFGLPDGWTEYGANGEEISRNARYKALGNAIVLPCAEYVLSGIKEVSTNA